MQKFLSVFAVSDSYLSIKTPREESDQTMNVQADLSLHWVHMSQGIFSHIGLFL